MSDYQLSIDFALDAANEEWKREAKAAVHLLIRRNQDFSTDDVLDMLEKLGVKTKNNSAIGGIMQKFSRDGYIRFIRFTPSQRSSRHGSPVRVWRPMEKLARV